VFFDAASNASYLVFGTFTYYIARLAPDMISLAEAPRVVSITGPHGSPPTSQNGVGILDDKPYLHEHAGVYYFSFGGFYALGSSPYGPFVQPSAPQLPTWVDPSLIDADFSLSGSGGPCWCQALNFNDRHGSFFSGYGQDFWSSNDRSHSTDPYNTNAYRDTILTYVHYFSNATIAPVVINRVGVGRYVTAEGVEAENFFALQGPGRKWHDKDGHNFGVTGLSHVSRLSYPHVVHGEAAEDPFSTSFMRLAVWLPDSKGSSSDTIASNFTAFLRVEVDGETPPLVTFTYECTLAASAAAAAGDGSWQKAIQQVPQAAGFVYTELPCGIKEEEEGSSSHSTFFQEAHFTLSVSEGWDEAIVDKIVW